EEAEILTLSSAETHIQLVLRNSSDGAVATTPGAHLMAIYNSGAKAPQPPEVRHVGKAYPLASKQATPAVAPPAAPSAPPPPIPRTVEVIRGTTRTEMASPSEPERKKETEKKKMTGRIHASYTLA